MNYNYIHHIQIFASAFGSTSIDAAEYITTCAKISSGVSLPSDGLIPTTWPGCSALSAYASQCALSGMCLEWRTSTLCPYSACDITGTQYLACGPSLVRNCENFKTYGALLKSFSTEGCYCSEDKVFFNKT